MERVLLCICYCYQGLAPIKVVRSVTFFIYLQWLIWSAGTIKCSNFVFVLTEIFCPIRKRTQFTNIYFLFSLLYFWSLINLWTWKWSFLSFRLSSFFYINYQKVHPRNQPLFKKTLRDFSHFLPNKWQEKEISFMFGAE